MRKVIPIFVVVVLLFSALLTACGPMVPPVVSSETAEPRPPKDFVLVADSSAQVYLGSSCNDGLLKLFKDKSGVCVNPVYMGNVEINTFQEAAIEGNNTLKADAFLVADGVWLSEKLTNPVKVAETNILFGVDSLTATALGWEPGSSHRIGDVADLMSSGELKTIVCNANQCNVGAMFFTGIVNRLKGDTGNPPTIDDFNNQTIIDAAKNFYANVARSGSSSDEAANIYLQDKINDSNLYNAIVLEESIGSKLNTDLVAANKSNVVFFYLSDANTVSSPTMGYLDSGDAQMKEIYDSFKAFIVGSDSLGYDAQKLIASTGWRSVTYGIKPSSDILKTEWGFMPSPNVAFVPVPKRDVMREAIRAYALYYKNPADIVMCLDNSGSMQGNNGFEGLKDAISKITDLGWLAKNQLYPSEQDTTKIYLFGTQVLVNEIKKINNEDVGIPWSVTGNDQSNLTAFGDTMLSTMGNYGDTALYDCAKVALDEAIASQILGHNTFVVLMTDGERTEGWYRENFIEYYKQTGTTIPIISIAFGENAKGELGYDSFGKYVNGLYFDGADLAGAFAKIWGGN